MSKHIFSPMLLQFWKKRYEDGETLRQIADSLTDFGYSLDPETLRTKLIEFGTMMRPRSRKKTKPLDIMLS